MADNFTANGSLILGPEVLNKMPHPFREALFNYVFPGLTGQVLPDPEHEEFNQPNDATDEDGDGTLAEFSEQEMRDFIGGCGLKTRQVLALLGRGNPHFELTAVAAQMGVGPSDLGGVWSGTTRRTRKIKGVPDAKFVKWNWNEKTDTWWGTLATSTHTSIKTILSAD